MEMVKYDLFVFTKIAKDRYTYLKELNISGSDSETVSLNSDVDVQFEQAFEDLIEKADLAEELIHDSMSSQIELLRKNMKYSEYILAGILVLTFLFALALSFILARGIANPLKQFQLLFNRGAEGDLSVRSSNRNKDEIGDLSFRFNEFIGKLGGTILKIKTSTDNVESVKDSLSASAEETSASIVNIKNGTASLLEESKKMDENVSENVASIEEITANINSIQDQINEQVAMVEESTAAITEMIASLENVDSITRKKTESVLRLVAAIEGGNNASNETDVKFQIDVIDKIDGISEMANSIQAIAAQTNLLSMNAAIEAAHAGDAGKGFAVVADEIRKLADTASKSSAEITKTIKEIADGIEGTGVVAQKKKDAFVIMNKEIKETKNAFDEIVTSVHELNSGGAQIQEAMVVLQDVSATIKNAASEMTVGAEHVIRGQLGLKDISGNISRGMLEINSGSEEIVIASEELVRYASELDEVVSGLKGETVKFTI
ncbi:MAG: methyl-accepting chemotaxis protein, partial [Spirochaetales bacterium]|nr:methyl-accepting chemotaxis protein [Spirochaetales bacterium]